ncbi:mechanosensitive ion channel family protein [Candidatus Woesearchaeota archaeon]|nr:mechanosensitive ion channel family protein [Candidatus Woesearchaeota archaeon]
MGSLGLIGWLTNWLAQIHPSLTHPFGIAFAVLMIFFTGARLFVYIVERWILMLTKKTTTDIDDIIVARMSWPLSILVALIGLKIATIPLQLTGRTDYFVHNALNTFVIINVTYMVVIIADVFLDKWGRQFAARTKSTVDDSLLPIAHKFSKIVIALIGLSFILHEWDIDVGPYLASLGIAGVVLGFALQDSLKNIFGGISLILDKNFKVGDVIRLSTQSTGTDVGTVEDIGLRSTKIKTVKNEMIVVPNGTLANATLVNLALPDPSTRLVMNFNVEYGSDQEKVKKIILEAVHKIQYVSKEKPPEIYFTKMLEYSMEFRLLLWINTYKDALKAEDQINSAVYETLNRHKISIPFPTRTVYMRKE